MQACTPQSAISCIECQMTVELQMIPFHLHLCSPSHELTSDSSASNDQPTSSTAANGKSSVDRVDLSGQKSVVHVSGPSITASHGSTVTITSGAGGISNYHHTVTNRAGRRTESLEEVCWHIKHISAVIIYTRACLLI